MVDKDLLEGLAVAAWMRLDREVAAGEAAQDVWRWERR